MGTAQPKRKPKDAREVARRRRKAAAHADPRRRRAIEEQALAELDAVRAPLFAELERLRKEPRYRNGPPEHLSCTCRYNQMRISPLEALAIARAFRKVPFLKRRLPQVLERLEKVLKGLRDTDERQSFDCPLLEGTKCLVHDFAKPIGCTAWHPPAEEGAPLEASYTPAGWKAFAARDRLNDRVYGRDWKLKVIPLWLKRVFARELKRWRRLRKEE